MEIENILPPPPPVEGVWRFSFMRFLGSLKSAVKVGSLAAARSNRFELISVLGYLSD